MTDLLLAGVDGCRGGWLCVVARAGVLNASVEPRLEPWLDATRPACVVVDMPIGLADHGPRACDTLARAALRPGRASSLFPAPVRDALHLSTYEGTCAAHRAVDGRAISRQTWFLLPKIRELDTCLQGHRRWRDVVHEGHPELSFATWNGGAPLAQGKKSREGREVRTALVEQRWPGQLARLEATLRGTDHAPDDLLDACALVWTAHRVLAGADRRLPDPAPTDRTGLPMCIRA